MTKSHGLVRFVRGKHVFLAVLSLALSTATWHHQALAASGVWNPVGFSGANGSGLWGTSTNWTGGTIADGDASLADFSTLNITAATTVSLDSSRTIGQLRFQDATTSSNVWILDNNLTPANVLTLSNGANKPTIEVLNQNATISLNLAGTNGFRKFGPNALFLSGNNSGLSGGVLLERGDINVASTSTTALGTGAIEVNPGGNNARIVLNSGVTLANAITMTTSNSGGGANGTIFTNGAFDATVSGNITINGVATSGGHFAGSTGTNFLNITGSVTNSMTPDFVAGGGGRAVIIRSGNTRMSGGGSSFRIDNRNGTLVPGINNGIPTNAVLNIAGNGAATLDLAGFNQTLVAISNFINPTTTAATVTNTGATPSTLTLVPHSSTDSIVEYRNISYGGLITDSGIAPLNIVLNGAATGSQTFANAVNTYSGTTTLTSGTLGVTGLADGGSSSSIGLSSSAASNLVFNGGTLRYTGATASTNRDFTINAGKTATIDVSTAATTLTVSGGTPNVSNGGLTKAGTGTLILSGTHSYTGTTHVSAGKLLVNDFGSLAAGSTVTVASGATLGGNGDINGTVSPSAGGIIAPGASVGMLTVGKLNLVAGAIVNLEFGGGDNDKITVSDAGGLSLLGGSINLLQEGTTNAYSDNGVTTLFNYNGGFAGSLSNLSIANAQAGKFYSLGSNGTAVQLTIGNATTVDWDGSDSQSWTAGGNWVGGSSPNAVGTSVRFNGTSLAGGSNTTVTVDGTGKTASGIIFNSDLSNTSFTISGPQTLTLDNGIGATAVNVNNGSHTIAAPVQLNGAATFTTANAGTLTVSGNISGARPVTVAGDGNVNLTGTNGFTTTALTGGALNVGTGGASGTLGSGNVTMGTGTNLNFNRSNAYAFPGNITGTVGSGNITQSGSGATTLSGAISQVGAINVTGGSLTTSNTVEQSGGITLSNAASMTASGNISGSGGITMGSTGTLTLGGSNTYAGQTTINSGTVVLNSAGALPNAAVLAVDGGVLNLNSRNITLSNVQDATTSTGIIRNDAAGTTSTITFAGFEANYNMYAALNDGAGGGKVALNVAIDNTDSAASRVLALNKPGTYTGGTTVSKQSIQANANNAFGTGPITVADSNSSVISSRIILNGGVSIPNNITIARGIPLAGNGVVHYLQTATGSSTVSGNITIQADNLNGGLFVGPPVANTADFLNVTGSVNVAGTATTIHHRGGNVRYSGGGNYPNMIVTGLAQLGAHQGLSQSAVVQVALDGSGTIDLAGFNQTLRGLTTVNANAAAVINSGTGPNTLTLNTLGSNTYAGTIDGNINLSVGGSGTQILTGANTYTGDTKVLGATLSITDVDLFDSADVYVANGGKLILDTMGGIDLIDSLFIDGVPRVGEWGGPTSGAANISLLLDGSGRLNVQTLGPALAGDYDANGIVDARDYVKWRDNVGTTNVLSNDPTGGTIGQTQYDTWRANFGRTFPGSSAGETTSLVPEPGTVGLLLLALCGAGIVSRRRTS